MSSNQNITTNFRDSNGVDLGSKLIRKDYLISVYPEIGQQIGIPPELWTWGYGDNGQLGNESITDTSTPVTTFSGGSNWKQVSSGTYFASAIKTDGTLWTWGSNSRGQLGNREISDKFTPITTFAGGTDWKQVSSAYGHIAAIKTDGTLWTWGSGYASKLGIISIANRSTPVTTFAGGTNWSDVFSYEPEDLYTLSVGGGNSLVVSAIKTDGTLWTWGSGDFGGLGNGSNSNISTPVTTFAGGTNWKLTSVGFFHTAAIKTDGTLWIWGDNTSGALGNFQNIGTSTPITTFAGGTNWKQVSSGDTATAAIKDDGTLWTWGSGFNGVLGNADITSRSTPVTTFAGGTNWKQVNAGDNYIAAIKTDGTLWTWGLGNFGQLGDSTNNSTVSTPITTFAGGTDWKQVSSGNAHATAVKTDGTLWAWGLGSNGALGNAQTTNRSTPVTTFAGGTNWKQVSAGGYHTTAIKTDGTLWTWGPGSYGQLGNADTTSRSTPVTTFAGGTGWKQSNAGYGLTIALRDDGVNKELFTWGYGNNGALGNTDITNRSTPVTTFAGGTNWSDVFSYEPEDLYTLSAGDDHTAAIKTDGTLWTWGENFNGELGNATEYYYIRTPITTFAGGTNWKQVSAGGIYTAAIKTDGTLWTWGFGSQGQLGNANTTSRFTPVTTSAGGTNWKQVSAGNQHTAAIKTDGTLWTWGNGLSGRLGNADTTSRSTPITTFAGGTDWKQVTAGRQHTAAIKTDGTLWTWGSETSGQLGNTLITGNISTPVTTFAGGTNWKQVSSGGYFTSAIKTDGTLWAWGNGVNGRLGNRFTVNRSTPVTTFAGGTNWKQVSTGLSHTAAIKTDGTLWTWGLANNGQLGNTLTTGTRSTPVTTFAGGTNWKQVDAGNIHTVALKDDGINKELYTFGYTDSIGINDFSGGIVEIPVTTFAGGTDWKQVNSGYQQTTAIKTDGTLWVWGGGKYGQLGNADITNRPTPVTTFTGGTDWKQVSSAYFQTVAIKTDGTLWTWGQTAYGILGNGNNAFGDKISTPITTFAGGTNWKQVSCSRGHTAAIKTDGTLWAWGDAEDGRLGNGVISGEISTPITTFAGGANWKQVSTGGRYAAAIKTDGTLWTWGYAGYGVLGNGYNLFEISTPITTFAGGANWKQVSCGEAPFNNRTVTAAIRSVDF
jgi:alpha-tubulin suppressor-like RCC1 family protein